MNGKRFAAIIAGSFILIISMNIFVLAQPTSMPHVIFGSVTNSDGTLMPGIAVKVTNQRTNEVLTVQANTTGQYQADLASLPNGYQVGDSIQVKAESGELSGIAEISVSTGPNDQCNIVIEETSGNIPFPAFVPVIALVSLMAVIIGIVRRRD